MIHAAVFLLSFSSLTFEVLLTRFFSISQWNHLSFMVISIALFGFAASGTFLSILDARTKGWRKRLSAGTVEILIICYSFSAMASYLVLNRMPLDYFRLPIEPVQIIYLLIAYLLLSLPFFFAGLIISVAYSSIPEKTAVIYFSSMAGSAFGAISPIPFLPLMGEGRLIILASILPLALLIFALPKSAEKNRLTKNTVIVKNVCAAGGITIAGLAAFLMYHAESIIEVQPSPYKSLSQILRFPDTYITKTATCLRGRIDGVKSPYVRFAPGLSLRFTGTLPNQWAVYKDGDNQFVFYDLNTQEDLKFCREILAFAGYLAPSRLDHVLVIQHGGGSGIPCALASGAKKISVIEQDPRIARMVRSQYKLTVVNESQRTFLARTDQLFSVIHIENWGTSLPGTAALNQEYYFTTEAFIEYINHLTKDGILIISRKLLLPPADSVRLWATAYQSLKTLGIENPERHIAVLRNWDTFTLLVSPQPLKHTESIKKFARNENFDLVFIRGISREMVNRFNIFDEPYHFMEINRLAQAYRSGTEKRLFKVYPLDVVPQSDDRPFPSRFLKWTRVNEFYQSTGSRLYTLLLSGEVVVAVVLFEALLVSIFLLLIPLITISKRHKKPSGSQILYFFSVGAGFMFVELFFIKKYVLLFGDPVISFTVVISGILIFSAAGGLGSNYIGHQGLRITILALIALLLLAFFSLDSIMDRVLGFSSVWRYISALLLLFPIGIMMGLPFPIGMRFLLRNPTQRGYAWAVNGCASVLTSIISVQIAVSLGINLIMACAVSAYFITMISANKQ
jgi:hypothetical protein